MPQRARQEAPSRGPQPELIQDRQRWQRELPDRGRQLPMIHLLAISAKEPTLRALFANLSTL